ncbi:hypothetical protein MAMC_00484 [Methylacidimicrobium cyclopophantes]|uniref:Cysteine-rich domain-containing protein n=1 Tax=Methylacidimicrobium cyclopophantes TaxID=1041766 RepID=A0A5E6M7A7_9BACT|nr:(Fe-S)-binding protein [Methylacidimicrobium cyclopophantes]VVM05252.1 hypothetical protein MAMC_00484 [Methylacidimicrobium cyclopophantes]
MRSGSAAGVDFAILGNEERCNGESSRRMGEEFLFQELAGENRRTLERYSFRPIVTHCPHCGNTFRRDYPQIGARFEIVHHSELLVDLLRKGRLGGRGSPSQAADAIPYHDPCYLVRVSGVEEAPRDRLSHRLAGPLREMGRRRKKTFCCGAGGERMWMEEDPRR